MTFKLQLREDRPATIQERRELLNEIERLKLENSEMRRTFGSHPLFQEKDREIERLRAALEKIDSWSHAYPLKVFPPPDLEKAAKVLKDNGMTLDAISADAMRHVVEGVGKIAREALKGDEQ